MLLLLIFIIITFGNSSVNAYSSPDEMGYSLSYFDGDYAGITSNPAIAAISGSGLDAASPDLYNGNIRHMITSIRQFMSGSNTPHAMAYQYDQLNRIRSSEMYSNINLGTNSWNSGGSGNAEYKEVFTYDHNGNIILQKRNGLTPTAMDDLHYYYYTTAVTPTTYDPQSGTPTDATNKLAYVTDAVSSGNYGDDIDNQSANNYTYDEIGQLKSDAQEEIATIAWTVYGKIRSVTRSGSSTKADLEFEYDAMGNRMLKITKPRTGGSPSTQDEWTYTYYVRDASGNVMSTYERTFTAPATTYDDILTLKEQNLYGGSRIGVRSPDLQLVSKNYTFSSYSGQLLVGTPVTQTTTATPLTSFEHVTGQKAYELSNHLGNVLVTVADARMPIQGTGALSGVVISYSAMVVSANDYSAFGCTQPGRGYSSSAYKYGFNGMLKDDEMHNNSGDSYDFGNRIYDARLGRFLSQDKFEIKYPELTPYNFAANSPIAAIDIGGDSIYVLSSDGHLYNVSTSKGKELAEQYGYSILMRTSHGAELVNKYQNSSSYDVYVTTANQSMGNEGARTSAVPLVSPKGNTGDLSKVYGEGSPLNKFSSMDLKNKGNQFALMAFNPDYINLKGTYANRTKYDIAESFFHEMKTHIDFQQQSMALLAQVEDPVDEALVKIQHFLYGVDHNNNLGLDAPNVRKGSYADIIRQEIKGTMAVDKAKEEFDKRNGKVVLGKDNTGDGDGADGIGH